MRPVDPKMEDAVPKAFLKELEVFKKYTTERNCTYLAGYIGALFDLRLINKDVAAYWLAYTNHLIREVEDGSNNN